MKLLKNTIIPSQQKVKKKMAIAHKLNISNQYCDTNIQRNWPSASLMGEKTSDEWRLQEKEQKVIQKNHLKTYEESTYFNWSGRLAVKCCTA